MKYDQIQKSLLRDVLNGELKPGDRLATRVELMEQFDTSRATIQRVMDVLQREGVIESNGKSGTFVASRPPNLYTVGIVFPASDPESPEWDSLWSIITNQKNNLEILTDKKFKFYYLTKEGSSCTEYNHLLDDVANSWLAGVIYPFPASSEMVEAVAEFNIPQVALTMADDKNYPDNVSCVWFDYNSFIDKSLDYFKQQGRKKLALLANSKLPMEYVEYFMEQAKSRGFLTDEMWTQAIGLDSFSRPWTSRLVKLLIQEGPKGRPDALIIANENLVGHAMNTLQQENLKIGDDIDLVMHSNFPTTGNGFNIQRVGFDIRKIIKQASQKLDDMRTTQATAKMSLIKADNEQDVK